jgi:hypothetical protein
MKKVVRLKESELIGLIKKVITEQNFDYASIEKFTDPNMIYTTIKDALPDRPGGIVDINNEAVSEAAFMAIADSPKPKELYYKVNAIFWKKDRMGLVDFMKSKVDPNTVYHKRSLNGSLTKIRASKV